MLDFLNDFLEKQYGKNLKDDIISRYAMPKYTTFRANTLLADINEVEEELKLNSISYEKINYNSNCFIIKDNSNLSNIDIYKNGKIYLQSISSMLPVWFLNPLENETILDMCAAPGSKTTQIAMLTNNKASITACEVNKIRASRLEYNLKKQNANAYVINKSALELDDFMMFDNILLDAPCSGSGTFSNGVYPKGFSKDLVLNSSLLQKKLLDKALKFLKPGNTMIYSTCSILDYENENVISYALKKHNCEIVPLDYSNVDYLEALPCKINGALVVKPNSYYEGFFVCKIKKR